MIFRWVFPSLPTFRSLWSAMVQWKYDIPFIMRCVCFFHLIVMSMTLTMNIFFSEMDTMPFTKNVQKRFSRVHLIILHFGYKSLFIFSKLNEGMKWNSCTGYYRIHFTSKCEPSALHWHSLHEHFSYFSNIDMDLEHSHSLNVGSFHAKDINYRRSDVFRSFYVDFFPLRQTTITPLTTNRETCLHAKLARHSAH